MKTYSTTRLPLLRESSPHSIVRRNRLEILLLLRSLVKGGFHLISVDDGDGELQYLSTVKEFSDAILAVDCSHLFVKHPTPEALETFFLYIVLGNDLGEAVCDYSSCKENHPSSAVLDRIAQSHYDRFNS